MGDKGLRSRVAALFIFALFSGHLGVAQAATVRTVRAGDDLQAALDESRPGDELRLEPGATFRGNFILPARPRESVTTLRTDLPDSAVPGPDDRVTPSSASRFAKIVSPTAGAAIRTAPGAHGWRLLLLEFEANKDGSGDIIQLGDGSQTQSDLASVPAGIVVDRVYIHGDPLLGQKRGIALNARAVTIRNCYIGDIKAAGSDAQAIAGWNGPGPFTIENNYLEASGEVFLLGGSDPAIPDLVSEDVSVRHNVMTRPMSWKDPIVGRPSNVVVERAGEGGLKDARYTYRIVARRPVGQGTIASSLPSTDAVIHAAGAVTIRWTTVPQATEYTIYRSGPAASGVAAVESWTAAMPPFTDRGQPGKPDVLPKAATRWQVKNLFELKNARRVRVEENLFENNWLEAQPGYAILLTPRNQDGRCPWCRVEQVEFLRNVVRNCSAGINIAGFDSPNVSRQTSGIRIAGNLFTQITTRLGGSGWAILIGDQPRDVEFDHNTFEFDGTTLLYAYGGQRQSPRPIEAFRFTNNAAPHGEYGINGADASTGTVTLQMYFPGATVTGNWLSGGRASKYPPGNRFDEPFEPSSYPAAPKQSGADVPRLLALADALGRGSPAGATLSAR